MNAHASVETMKKKTRNLWAYQQPRAHTPAARSPWQEQTHAQAGDGAATPSMGCHIFSTSHFARAAGVQDNAPALACRTL